MSDPSDLKERLEIAAYHEAATSGVAPEETLEGRALDYIAKLEEALEPFLRLADEVVNAAPDSDIYREWLEKAQDWLVIFSFAGRSVTLGDLRQLARLRARAVRGGGEEEGNSPSSAKSAARPNALPPASEVTGGGEP